MNEPVFSIGFPKTGNTSLREALEQLGYSARRAPVAFRHQLWKCDYRMPEGINAITNCSEHYYAQLATRYPEARFVLTTRNMEDWLRSCQRYFSITKIANGLNVPWRYITMIQLFGTPAFDRERFEFAYNQHIENVKRYFGESKQLLITDVIEDGWSKLCPFLGVDVPDVPFPCANVTDRVIEKSKGVIAGSDDVPTTPAARDRAVKRYVSDVVREWVRPRPKTRRRK